MDTAVLIILTIILLIIGMVSSYITIYNRLQKCIIRINEAESQIDESIRKRYDVLTSMEKTINDETHLNQDNFSEFKKSEMSNFEVDRKLTQIEDLFKKIKLDFEKELDTPDYREKVISLKKNNELCDASKTFYNKYTTKLNMLVRRFPTNIIARIHGINTRLYFDNKNMSDNDILDFKL